MSSFWDRRRAAVAAEAQAEVEATHEEALVAQEAALAARSDDELLAELDLPAPEDLVGGEQLRAFLRAQLPQRLKSRALRTFWRSNPVLACLDGLNDYDDDYTAAATAGKAVNTLYQVGKGFPAPLADLLEQVVEDAQAPAEMTAGTVSVPDVVPPVRPSTLTTSTQTTPVPVAAQDAVQVTAEGFDADFAADDDTPMPTARRMRFEFASDVESTGA
tara:strand:- start:19500 stop:20150 length:651 start_codon:yes stop_codon:yes gene_type:complete